eukprot:PITA_06413
MGDLGVMKITLKPDVKPIKHRPYRVYPKYKEKVKEELEKMVAAGIIEPVEESDWLHATLGHTRYYQKLIKAYVQITTPMEKLLKKDATFCWDDDFHKCLDVLKEKMVTASILVFADWKKDFHVHVDALCIALGVDLVQPREGDLDHPIAFASRNLS